MASNSVTPALVNEHEAARVLGISVLTLRRWRWAGRPPEFLKIGSAVRYDPAVLASFVDSCRRSSTARQEAAPRPEKRDAPPRRRKADRNGEARHDY